MLSDEEFLGLLEKYNYSYKIGSIVKGTVEGYDGNSVLVDINTKALGVCPFSEVLISKTENITDILKLKESYEFVINSLENEDGVFYLSHKKVVLSQNVYLLEEKFKNDEVVTGKVTNLIKGGVLVNVMGLKGFVPTSQMKDRVEVSDEIQLKILTLELPFGNFILSNKKVYSDIEADVKKDILEKIELNMVVKGKVVRITEFGAFIDIGGIDALLPLSQISWKWIDNPNDVIKCDDIIDVEIIGIDKEKQRVSLSLKTLEENPWIKASEVLKENKVVTGKVTRIKPFGAFVEVYDMVEGLLNRPQIKEYENKYRKELKENDEIEVLIKRFSVDNQKINLEIV